MGIRITYTVQSCPLCGRKLLKQDETIIRIGSPLLHCRNCHRYYKTNMRQEWFQIPNKVQHFLMFSFILMPLCALSFLFTTKDIRGLLVGAVGGFVLGLLLKIPELFRLVGSLIRMRNPEYLRRLRDHGIISQEEYDTRLDARIK